MTPEETAALATFRRLLDQPGTPAFRAGIDQAVLARICDATGDPKLNALIHEAWGSRRQVSAPSAPTR